MTDKRGQIADDNVIKIAVVFVIGLLVTSLVVAEFYKSTMAETEDDRITTTDNTVNRHFSDNVTYRPSGWDNEKLIATTLRDNTNAKYENLTDNDKVLQDNIGDNGILVWRTSFSVSSLRDGVSSATVYAKYVISDNTNLDNLNVRVYFGTLTDNVAIYNVSCVKGASENTLDPVADNTSWHSVEYGVTSMVNARGVATYYIWLYDNTQRAAPLENYVSIRWDNVYAEVNTYDHGITGETVTAIGDRIPTTYLLMAILLIVIIAAAMLKYLGML